MNKTELLRYGNELTICGFVVGNGNKSEIFMFPGEHLQIHHITREGSSDNYEELLNQVIRQMDVNEVEGLQKIILRKSQRNMDTRVSWEVFRRDNFTCVYCGEDKVPMTVDHIVLWEHMGDSVPDNLNCSCKKCNKTRGSMDYEEWICSAYLNQTKFPGLKGDHLTSDDLLERGNIARKLPLRKTKRSR